MNQATKQSTVIPAGTKITQVDEKTPANWCIVSGDFAASDKGTIRIGKSYLFPNDVKLLLGKIAEFVEFANKSEYREIVLAKESAKQEKKLEAALRKEIVKQMSLEQMQQILNALNK